MPHFFFFSMDCEHNEGENETFCYELLPLNNSDLRTVEPTCITNVIKMYLG